MTINRIKLFSGVLRTILNIPDHEKIIKAQSNQESFGATVSTKVEPYRCPRRNQTPKRSKTLMKKRHINNWPKEKIDR